MNYVFFSVIIISTCTSFVYKRKNLTLILLLFILIALIFKYPQISVNSSKDGINLWLFVVLPSLLPFFIINDMLVSLKVPENISKLFTPFARILFNTSGYGAYVFIMSIFSGYPTGAKIVSDLINRKKISSQEGQKILTFSSTSGPLFIVGVVGAAMLRSTNAGYILILSHILGAVVNGILFSGLLGRDSVNNAPIEKTKSSDESISEMFTKAILNSFLTCGLIGGYIVLFSVIIALLNKIEFFNIFSSILITVFMVPKQAAHLISSFLQAALEISNGAKILTGLSIHMDQKLILLSFIIAFSGVSIIGQVSSLISKTNISLSLYIVSKITHGLISSVICYIFINLNIFELESSKNIFSLDHYILNVPILLESVLVLMLFFNLLYRGLIMYKYARFYKNK